MIKPYLCEVLTSLQDIEGLAGYIFALSQHKYKFFLSGEYTLNNNKIIPNVQFLSQQVLGESTEYLCYIYEEINKYICYVQETKEFMKRDKPWQKPYKEFSINLYESFKIEYSQLQKTETTEQVQLHYIGSQVQTIAVEYPHDFLIPKELYFLLTYQHQYLVNTFGITSINNQYYLLLKRHSKTLEEFLSFNSINKTNKVLLMTQLFAVMWFLHSKKIAGVKWNADKIFVDSESKLVAKVWDFSDADIFECEDDEEDEETKARMMNSFKEKQKEDVCKLGETFLMIVGGRSESEEDYEEMIRIAAMMASRENEWGNDLEQIYKALKAI